MRPTFLFISTILVAMLAPTVVLAKGDLAPEEFRSILQVGFAMQRTAQYDDINGGPDRFVAFGDRSGRLSVYGFRSSSNRGRLWSSHSLDGNVEEVLVADLDNDGVVDHLVCRTPRRVYAFDIRDEFRNTYESLPNHFRSISAFTVANVDRDHQQEIVVAADDQIHYVDGSSFLREWTSMDRYQVIQIRAGDVDGDRSVELVLDTGQVLDASSGREEWAASDPFGTRLELLDLTGDGFPEIVGESPGLPLRIWEGSSQRELRVH